jgi:ABC-type Fe3+/spermidine/putrescine transport system ATPase subunit
LSPELAAGLGETNFLRGITRGGGVETPLGLLRFEDGPAPGGATIDGAALLVLVRPEQIVLSSEPGDDRATARVVEAEFYGHDAVVRLRVDWDDSKVLVARTSDVGTLPEEGTRVGVSVRGRVVAWTA